MAIRSLTSALGLIAVLTLGLPASAQTAHSLDQVPGLIKTPEGRAVWNQELKGKAEADGLGAHLPTGLAADQIVALLVPREERGPIILVDAKPWPQRANTYVAIVCTGDVLGPSDEPSCEADTGASVTAYVGVIAMPPGSQPHLIATSGPFAGAIRWDQSDLPAYPAEA